MTAPPAGWRLRVHESLASTTDPLLRLAAAGEPEGIAVLALRQTAGRGRDGRAWESPAGNLYLSVLLRPGGLARDAGQWALLSAVALHDALAPDVPPGAALAAKWPNDLLLDGAKVAGILTDSAADAEGRIEWIIFGMGANLAVAPAVPGRATACLARPGQPAPEPRAVAARVLAAIDHWRGVLAAQGFGAIREAWVARGPAIGQALTMRDGRAGTYAGLAADGSLLLAGEGRVQALSSGEVGGEAR
ncbi:biotin--[acetyl-CoA-carboxylase] ligase [Falsiroseomonas ponticola]|uniref:biotin--[acetyl-CoA-carboxylase] ligase n=1 Tax=Falsiroseomonas ponticola TaxID=2786951 RepID=UPI001932AC53|nr:biotin--[acetyl-CoA-carboxylase] ligase [Roseomonas ponticola]